MWHPTTTHSFYDPEEEFEEIALSQNGSTLWKFSNQGICDAIANEAGETIYLIHNALHNLSGITSKGAPITHLTPPPPYGPHLPSSPTTDLTSYAQTLTWKSKAPDPTGLIYLGKRHYDPQKGRFLSPDPLGFTSPNLYTYANNDPINFHDLDGRCFSAIYSKINTPAVRGAVDSAFEFIIDSLSNVADLLLKLAYAEEVVDAAAEGRPVDPSLSEAAELGYSGIGKLVLYQL